MTSILCLPNETLVAITANLEIPDLAALVLTNRRFCSVAHSALYAAAARDDRAARLALFYSAENGFTQSVRALLAHGANPNAVYESPVPRDCLHRVLARQGRRPGRQPLIDRQLALEFISVVLRGASQGSEVDTGCKRLLASLFGEPNDLRGAFDAEAYAWLIVNLQVVISPVDRLDARRLPRLGALPESVAELETQLDWGFLWTALHVAADRGDDELARLLLDSGAAIDPFVRTAERFPALCARGSINTAEVDIASATNGGDEITERPICREAPLYLAIAGGHKSTAELLLTAGAPTVVCWCSITALHVAAGHGALDMCRFLVDNDATLLERRTDRLLTPFHSAAAAGKLQTIGRFLLERGADLHTPFETDRGRFNVFTHAISQKRYADALELLDMDPSLAVPQGNQMHPLTAFLHPQRICREEEGQMHPIFRRVLLDPGQPAPALELYRALLDRASFHHLHRVVDLLLEVAPGSGFPDFAIHNSLGFALRRSSESDAAIMTARALIDYAFSNQNTPALDLCYPFLPSFDRRTTHVYDSVPVQWDLHFTKEGVLERTLEIAGLLHDRLVAGPKGSIDRQDLRLALMAACQPGGLRACEWLAGLGAIDCVDHVDLVTMLARTAPDPERGLNDVELAEWVLKAAVSKGVKDWVVAKSDVPRMILMSRQCAVARLLLEHGASLDAPVPGGPDRPPQLGGVKNTCHTRHRRRNTKHIALEYADNVLFVLCNNPDVDGAPELLRLAVAAAGDDAYQLVNCSLTLGRVSTPGRLFSPASLVCLADGWSQKPGDMPAGPAPPSEPARLAMLKILMDAGAEVHAVVECPEPRQETPGQPGRDKETPRESLWDALFWEETRLPGEQERLEASPPGLPRPRGELVRWRYSPVECAIQSKMPTLVQAILEARPLRERNSPEALTYLISAVSGWGHHADGFDRLCPRVLEAVLELANLEHADVVVDEAGRTALMHLIRFFAADDLQPDEQPDDRPELQVHDCRCDPDFIGFENGHLSRMAGMLLARGARWNTRPEECPLSALGELRLLLSEETKSKSVYKQHNLAEFRKHLVLDIYSDAAARAPDFNPFEWGAIKATWGVS
jgi:ankyrin repeat protein